MAHFGERLFYMEPKDNKDDRPKIEKWHMARDESKNGGTHHRYAGRSDEGLHGEEKAGGREVVIRGGTWDEGNTM